MLLCHLDAIENHFVEDEVHLVQVVHYVKLTDVPEVSVQRFDGVVDELQYGQLILIPIHANQEEERCVPPVDHLRVREYSVKVRGG
jgi:hypothetical protein